MITNIMIEDHHERTIRILHWLIFILIIGSIISTSLAIYFLRQAKQTKCKSITPKGYTKIDYGKAIDQNGDTIKIFEYSEMNKTKIK